MNGTDTPAATSVPGFLPRDGFQALLDALRRAGYACLGPRVREGALVLGPVERVEEMAAGWIELQSPGQYRLEHLADSQRLFGWTTGPQALKPLTFAPEERLWRTERGTDGGLSFHAAEAQTQPRAVIGVRGCDLAALALQDAHFLAGPEPEPCYRNRRQGLLLVAVDCVRSAPTCFCVSTGDGPALSSGFDIGLSELEEGFLVRAGSPAGQAVVNELPLAAATDGQLERARAATAFAAAAQTRRLPPARQLARLFDRLDHQRWKQVAARCLGCGNCTSVCPTCFCFSAESRRSLDGRGSEQVRVWDSCFRQGHSAMHGRPVRIDICSRYRQWATHKLAGWQAQYGRPGCVGCGRCITWCPVGIDIVEEALAVLEESGSD